MDIINKECKTAIDYDNAISYYLNLLNKDPYNVQIYYNLISVYQSQNDIHNALLCIQKLIGIDPYSPNIYFAAGCLYSKINDFDNAIQSYNEAIILNPEYVQAYINIALIYHDLKMYDISIECNRKALAINPNFVEIYNNLGNTYINKSDLQNAINITKQGLELYPDDERLKLNLARAQMIMGDIDNSWVYFKLRRQKNEKKNLGNYLIDYSGGGVKGKTVYVYWDTGLGDTIQLCRYLPMLNELGAKVLFKPQQALERLIEENDLKVQIMPDNIDDSKIVFDYQINLTSLAYLFKSDINNFPYKEKYLKANTEKVKLYKDSFFDNNKFKVGIVWQSSTPNRSIPNINKFLELSKLDNVELYSLQKGEAENQLEKLPDGMSVVNLGKTFNDFSDTAAAIENLDLLISVDTSVSHLAGAMGKPVWMLKIFDPDWRWFLDRTDSPWYSSMRLFRQTKPNRWNTVINDVYEALITHLKTEI